MPEVVVTPAQLRWSGGALSTTPLRFEVEPAPLRWAGGFIVAGPGTGTNLSVTTPKLERIRRLEPMVETSRAATMRFQLIQQRNAEAIEAAFAALTQQVSDNTAILNEIRAVLAVAQAADAKATSVQTTVSLANSYVEPTSVLSASSDGTITVAAHTRVYGDTHVSVGAGSVSGFAQGDYVQVYYDDAAREGGTVTYQGTTGLVSQEDARHIVGGVAIPAAGSPPVEGQGPRPPGYVFERTDEP